MLRYRIAALALMALLLPALGVADDKEAPSGLEGTWKVSLPWTRARNTPYWLIKIEKKGDDFKGEVAANSPTPGAPKGKLQDLKVTKDTVAFAIKADDITLRFEVKRGKVDKMLGTMNLNRRVIPAVMERTTLKTLDPYVVDKDALAREPLGHEAIMMVYRLVGQAADKKATAAEVRKWGDKAIQSAELYGPALKADVLLTLAGDLGMQEGFEATALQFARKAEQMLEKKATPAEQKRVLDVLASALEKAGREEEAKTVKARILKLDFRVKPIKFAGRKAKSDRVVLVEMFANAEEPTSPAADMAFEALGKTYKPSEVVLLRYHVHVPKPDPLTAAEGETRMAFYEAARRAPTVVFNGRAIPGGGGPVDAQDKYEDYVNAINPLLEKPSEGTINLTATRDGDKVKIVCDVKGLAKAGDDVRLRLALAESVVAFKGGSNHPRHVNVVRFMPGGDGGTVMKKKEGKYEFIVDVAELKKNLTKYLDEYHKKRPFPGKDRPLELKNLKVVAFVQDDMSAEVLQAAQVDVPAGKPDKAPAKDKPKKDEKKDDKKE
jgi:hypothetical protein